MNSPADSHTEQQKFPVNFTVLLLFMAALLRLPGLFGELQYDEIWTLVNFVPLNCFQIITDISLPNNHPVNTLVLKFLYLFSEDPAFLRLGVYAASLAVVYLCGKCVYIISERRSAQWGTMFLAATAIPLISFSTVARGYTFQLLGILLCAAGLLCWNKYGNKRAAYILLPLGGTVAFTAVSSGVMFLLSLAAAHLFFAPSQRRFGKPVLIGGTILAAAVLGYYIPLYSELRTGQRWGNEITGFLHWAVFCLQTLAALIPLTFVPWIFAGWKANASLRKALPLALLPLIIAPLTKAGQERVYLPLLIYFIAAAGYGFGTIMEKLPNRRKLWVSLLALSGTFYLLLPPDVAKAVIAQQWQLPTPTADLQKVLNSTHETVLPVVSSSAGYPIRFNYPQVIEKINNRTINAASLYIVGCAETEFNGADSNYNEIKMQFPVSGETGSQTLPGCRYILTPADVPQPQQTLLVVFYRGIPETFLQTAGKKLRLNLWLNQQLPLYICSFDSAEIPYFEGAKYYLIGEKK